MSGGQDVVVSGRGDHRLFAVARELARRGAGGPPVRSAVPSGAGATQASAGILAPYIEAHERGPAVRSGRAIARPCTTTSSRDVSAESGLEVEYRRCGTLEVAIDASHGGPAARICDATDPALQWLDRRHRPGCEAALATSIEGAVARLGARLRGGPAADGRTVRGRRSATASRSRPPTASPASGFSAPASRIHTEDGTTWAADSVVIAAGSWSGQLHLEDTAASAVRPVRGQLLRLHWRGAPLDHIVWGPDCYVVPWRNNTVLVGATVEDVGFDERTTAAGVRDLLDAVCELLPEAWRATFIEARVGLRPATPRRTSAARPFTAVGPDRLRDRPLSQRRPAGAPDRPGHRRLRSSAARRIGRSKRSGHAR